MLVDVLVSMTVTILLALTRDDVWDLSGSYRIIWNGSPRLFQPIAHNTISNIDIEIVSFAYSAYIQVHISPPITLRAPLK